MAQVRPSHLTPLTRRFLIGSAHALFKRDREPRNLCVRTSSAMAQVRPSHLTPLTRRFLIGSAHALFFTIVAKSIIFAKFGFINVTVC
ncbi:hypothetical protein FAM18121_01059 [Lacticaseibacillus paracasei]|nr:hypothetical protein FAM18121_01059 [Lacticaseibacillus paracasei]